MGSLVSQLTGANRTYRMKRIGWFDKSTVNGLNEKYNGRMEGFSPPS